MTGKLRKSVWIVFGVLFISFFAFPQIREAGIIQGNVTDADGNYLPGVSVSVESPNLIGGKHTRVTDARGFYKFPGMTVGIYKVTAELTGFKTVITEGVAVHANKTLTVDFKLIQAALASEVVVQAQAPTIDVKSSQLGTVTFTNTLLLSLPGKPTFEGLLNMAPGTDFYTAYGSGYASPNTYQLDGTYVSNPAWGGINFTIDTSVIEEATFQGLGMPAEFGEASGAVLTAVTKSGSNKLSGFFDFRYNGDGWNSQNLGSFAESEFADPATKYEKRKVGNFLDGTGQVGGRIVRDKLWFFLSGGYDYSTSHALGTTVTTKYYTPKFFSKLTYQLNKSNKFSVAYKFANDVGKHILAGAWIPPEVDLDNNFPGHFVSGNWSSILSPNTFLDVKFGANFQRTDQMPTGGTETPGHYDYFTGEYSVNWDSYNKSYGRTYHLSAHLSQYVPDFIGSHDIKFGAEIQRDKTKNTWGYCGGVSYDDWDGEPYYKSTSSGSTKDYTFGPIVGFLQDTWTPIKKLTFNIGFRYDHVYFKIPRSSAGLVYKNDSVAPRLGLTYDLLGDRKNIVKLYYGHLVEKINRNQFQGLDTRHGDYARYEWIDDEWVYLYGYSAGESEAYYTLDPNTKHPYMKELSGAYERELFKDAALTVNFYYRTLGRALGLVDTGSQWEKFTITNPGPDGVVGTSDDLGPLDVYQRSTPYSDVSYQITNPTKGCAPSVIGDVYKKAKGFEINFNKRYSNRWQLLASYHWTNVKGTIDNVQAYFYDPNQFVNNLGTYYYGQPHHFKLQGSVLLPLNIMMGMTAQYMSGHSPQAYFYTDVNGQFTYIRGYAGGVKRCGPLKDVSMKFEKKFDIKSVQLSAYIDFYNIFNFHGTPYAWNRVNRFGPNYGKLNTVQSPRSFRLGTRFYF
jgi:hypothetical protein